MAEELRPVLSVLRLWVKAKNNDGLWPSGLRHTHGVRGIAGSNPASPTGQSSNLFRATISYPRTLPIFSSPICLVRNREAKVGRAKNY